MDLFGWLAEISVSKEWLTIAEAITLALIGVSVGTWLWQRVLKLILLILCFVIISFPVFLIIEGVIENWKEVAFVSFLIGFIGSLPLIPFLVVSETQETVLKFIEKAKK